MASDLSGFEVGVALVVLGLHLLAAAWLVRWLVRSIRRDGWPTRSDLVEAARQTPEVIRAIPGFLAERSDMWLMRQHHAVEPFPAPCVSCKQLWPCDAFMEAGDRRAARGPSSPEDRNQ